MRLAAFFEAIGPYLEGRRDEAEARRLLYGDRADSVDARRIAIYGRFCRIHRSEALDLVYEKVRAEIEARGGAAMWERLHEAFFAAHPMHSAELGENGEGLGEFLGLGDDATSRWAAANGLPEWLGALADLEWWEWRTRVIEDDPSDDSPEEGPLRLASTVEVRPYAWDLCGYLDELHEGHKADHFAAPSARSVYVLFWRDRDLDDRREEASTVELLALKAVFEGTSEPCPRGVSEQDWRDTLADLREAGIVLGR